MTVVACEPPYVKVLLIRHLSTILVILIGGIYELLVIITGRRIKGKYSRLITGSYDLLRLMTRS